MNSVSIQKLCAWGGVINMLFYGAGMIIAGFIPVPGPSLTEAEVSVLFRENHFAILGGSIIMLLSGLFLVPLIALISAFMKRIEGPMPIMSYSQMVSGTIGILFFYLPALVLLVAAFRSDRAPESIYLFYDFAFMLMIIAWPSFVFQNGSIAVAIFSDKRRDPILPRWLGYFQLWTAVLYLGSVIGPFFKAGPFAWNGLFAFWIPAIVFFAWNLIMMLTLTKAIDRQSNEARPNAMVGAI